MSTTQPATPHEDQLSVWGPFVVPAQEAIYRSHQAAGDRRIAQACVLVALLGCLAFVPSDYRLFGRSEPFATLLVVRAALVLISIGVWWRLRQPLSTVIYDRLLLLWAGMVVAQILYVTSTRPPTYAGHAVVNLSTVMLIYTVVPLSLCRQLLLAGTLSLGCALLAAHDGLGAAAVGWSFLGANVLGLVVSRRQQHHGRAMFAAQARLEQALAEVRTLRGLIEVCAWCRKVADEGQWTELESFVREHTHADFTHSICPCCYSAEEAKITQRQDPV